MPKRDDSAEFPRDTKKRQNTAKMFQQHCCRAAARRLFKSSVAVAWASNARCNRGRSQNLILR